MNFERHAKINLPIVLRTMGWLLMIEALFMVIPLITSVIYGDHSFSAFLSSIIITGSAGALMTFSIKPRYKEMGKRDALLLTSMVWVIFSLFGTIPLMLTAPHLSFTDAYFEAVSGFTTTGATVIRDVEVAPKGILMWRALTHWIGGMGIILFTLAVLPMLNHQGGIQLFNAEVTGISHDKLRPRISETAKGLWMVYVFLTVLLVILLYSGPMNLFDSICQTLATVSTGGFSTRNGSIGSWNSHYVEIVVSIFMFICGINFALLYKVALGKPKSLFKNDTFICYSGITALMIAFIVINNVVRHSFDSFGENIISSIFHVIATITSTGFGVANFESWGQFALALFFFMMFFGSCAGSTAGGAKIDRMIYLVKNMKNEFYRVLHPNSVTTVRINDKVIPYELVSKVIAFLCLYVIIIVVVSTVLTAIGIPIFDASFATLSAMSNIGFGVGYTGVNGSFADIPDVGKWLLAFTMITGRLELFTFLIIFTRDFWTK